MDPNAAFMNPIADGPSYGIGPSPPTQGGADEAGSFGNFFDPEAYWKAEGDGQGHHEGQDAEQDPWASLNTQWQAQHDGEGQDAGQDANQDPWASMNAQWGA